MSGMEPFDVDENEALGKLERLWSSYEEAFTRASGYAGSLGWKTNAGQEYLVHTVNLRYEGNRQRSRSLGPRSEATERRKAAFEADREQSRTELARIEERLAKHARVLKALRIGRVPAVTARFLRELRTEGFGVEHFRIGGAAALAAYEVAARFRMPFADEVDAHFDLFPTEMFVRDRMLFDAIAARKIFGPIEEAGDRIVLGRGIVLRLLSDRVVETWIRDLLRNDASDDEIDAIRWAVEIPSGIPLLAVGLDGTPAPVAALDPRAFAILAAAEARRSADPTAAATLKIEAGAVAQLADALAPAPFEREHLALFPELVEATDGGEHADDRLVMRP